MSSTINPLLMSTGINYPISFPTGALTPSGSSSNPYGTPAVPSGPSSSNTNQNPYSYGSSSGFPAYGFGSPTSTMPTIGSSGAPGGYGTGGGAGGPGGVLGLGETPQGWQTLQKGLDTVYGSGVGNALTQFLASGAGYSPQVLQQLFAQLQPGFASQQQNLLQQFSAGGNRFGSGAQIGYADLLGQQGLTEGDMAAQLYENAVQNYMSVLTGAGAETAGHPQPSIWDQISSALGLAGSAAGGASAITSAVSPSSDTGILDALAGAFGG